MVVVTNRIPVSTGHEIDFEDRFKRRVHLVDRHPGFVRNEVHRPRPMRFDHEQRRLDRGPGRAGLLRGEDLVAHASRTSSPGRRAADFARRTRAGRRRRCSRARTCSRCTRSSPARTWTSRVKPPAARRRRRRRRGARRRLALPRPPRLPELGLPEGRDRARRDAARRRAARGRARRRRSTTSSSAGARSSARRRRTRAARSRATTSRRAPGGDGPSPGVGGARPARASRVPLGRPRRRGAARCCRRACRSILDWAPRGGATLGAGGTARRRSAGTTSSSTAATSAAGPNQSPQASTSVARLGARGRTAATSAVRSSTPAPSSNVAGRRR